MESYIINPLLSLEVDTPKDKSIHGRYHPYARKSALKAVLSRMQLTLYATRPTPQGASRLVQAMSAGSVKTRRAPSRYCRYARVYGHTTTVMHNIAYTPPPQPLASIGNDAVEHANHCVS